MKYAVCAIARLENHYIREWVEHYKSLGFDNIVLYDNNMYNEEHFEDVINDYITSGFVILKNIRGQKTTHQKENNIQIKAYSECYKIYSNQFDWILYVDIDEFLEIKNYNNINDFINSNPIFNNYTCINFCWKYYDDNGLIKVENGNYNCKTRFTHWLDDTEFFNLPGISRRNDDWNPNATKSIIRTKQNINKWWAHGYDGIDRSCYADGSPVGSIGQSFKPNKYNIAWINHYRYKTAEEFAYTKMIRNWPDKHMWDGGKNYLNENCFFKFNKRTPEKELIFKQIKEGTYNKINNNMLKTAVCCIIKNENPYLHEWCNHYKNLGFTNIILYDNNDIEDPKSVIQDYIDSGFVIYINYRNKLNMQILAYNNCINVYGKLYDWIAFFDADEYLTLYKDTSIYEYLSRDCFKQYNSIHINWRNFGDNNLLGNENNNDRSIKRFKEPLPMHHKWPNGMEPNKHIKTILKTKELQNASFTMPHVANSKDQKICNNIGGPSGNSPVTPIDWTLSSLDHYSRKTILEYAMYKLNRTWADGNSHKVTIDDFWWYNQKTPEKIKAYEDYISERYKSENTTKQVITSEPIQITNTKTEITNTEVKPVIQQHTNMTILSNSQQARLLRKLR